MAISIYSNRQLVIAASEFISNNRVSAYIGMKGHNTFYNVNGIVWEVWQDGISENFETAIWRSTWVEVSREFESFEAFMKFMKELLLKAEKAAAKKVLSLPVH